MTTRENLVLTHVQTFYNVGTSVQQAIQDFIARHSPDVQQLVNPNPNIAPTYRRPIIEIGDFFDSSCGELPKPLKLRLQQDAHQGKQTILAGGEDGACLEITFRELRGMGINPKVLFDGVYPKKGDYSRLFRELIYSGRYIFK